MQQRIGTTRLLSRRLSAPVALFCMGLAGCDFTPTKTPKKGLTEVQIQERKTYIRLREEAQERMRIKIDDALVRLSAEGISRDDLKEYFREEILDEYEPDN